MADVRVVLLVLELRLLVRGDKESQRRADVVYRHLNAEERSLWGAYEACLTPIGNAPPLNLAALDALLTGNPVVRAIERDIDALIDFLEPMPEPSHGSRPLGGEGSAPARTPGTQRKEGGDDEPSATS